MYEVNHETFCNRLLARLSGCSGLGRPPRGVRRQKTVNDVMADPGRYRDREVSVKGEVAESEGVLGRGFFKLQDGSGSLWVYTTRGLPRKGARVSSKGRVRDLATVDQLANRESVPEIVRQATFSPGCAAPTNRIRAFISGRSTLVLSRRTTGGFWARRATRCTLR